MVEAPSFSFDCTVDDGPTGQSKRTLQRVLGRYIERKYYGEYAHMARSCFCTYGDYIGFFCVAFFFSFIIRRRFQPCAARFSWR